MATYRELLSQVKARDRRDRRPGGARLARGRRPSSSTSASATSGTRGTSPARSTCRAATSSRGSRTPSPTATAASSSTAPSAPARRSRRRRSRSSATPTSSTSPAATRSGSGTASRPSCRKRSASSSARRYSRHLLIPEVGEEGQLRLLESRILLIGAGGLGSPASLYLAAAGVGTLGIVDDDAVDETNLQRQIVHSTERLGESKAESAKRTIEALNPDVTVKTFQERLTSENVDRILGEGWDVIVDGADNFPTRYLLNDASVWHDIPVVHGSIFRFEGQVTVFKPNEGPCYRCLFPQPPPPELAPSCAEGGVLGVLPGVIGSIQATEALKLALGIGDPLVGRLLLFDALAASFTEVTLRRDPACPVCGESPTITEYIDYVEFCRRLAARGAHA